jgi:N-acetylneuraminate synthase
MTGDEITIAGRKVGPGEPAFIVAEVGQSHDGSLGMAHAFIDVAADARVDAIKFQTHIASAESTPAETFRVAFSQQDATRTAYWERTAFDEEGWQGLARHAEDRSLVFLSSPFSIEAVDILERVGMAAWKVGSGEVTNIPLLERMAETRRPVLLSSGLSSFADLDAAVNLLRRAGTPFAMFQATTAYPTAPEQVGLNVLEELRTRYGCPVGLSDHSGTIFPSLAAVTLGASLVEVHLTLAREMFGPDVVASVTPDELAELVRGTRYIETALSNPVAKDALSEELEPLKLLFGRSVVAARPLPAGTVLTQADLALKKPGGGFPPDQLSKLVGRRLTRPLEVDAALGEEDVE